MVSISLQEAAKGLQEAEESWAKKNKTSIWSNYSDLTRPHPKWWFSKGNPLNSGKPRLVKHYNLARSIVL